MNEDQERQVIDFINVETRRLGYGKLFIEVNVAAGKATNIQCETKRSMNINN
jgi:hypothetical protein